MLPYTHRVWLFSAWRWCAVLNLCEDQVQHGFRPCQALLRRQLEDSEPALSSHKPNTMQLNPPMSCDNVQLTAFCQPCDWAGASASASLEAPRRFNFNIWFLETAVQMGILRIEVVLFTSNTKKQKNLKSIEKCHVGSSFTGVLWYTY